MNLVTANRPRHIFIILAILIFSAMLVLGGIVTAIVLHQNSVHKLSEKMRVEGPWNPEPSIWASAENDAFLICNNQNSDRICTITAFFRTGGKWSAFTMNQKNGSKELVFESADAEFAESVFSCSYDFKDGLLTFGKFKKIQDDALLPDADAFAFTRLGNYEDAKGSIPQDLLFLITSGLDLNGYSVCFNP